MEDRPTPDLLAEIIEDAAVKWEDDWRSGDSLGAVAAAAVRAAIADHPEWVGFEQTRLAEAWLTSAPLYRFAAAPSGAAPVAEEAAAPANPATFAAWKALYDDRDVESIPCPMCGEDWELACPHLVEVDEVEAFYAGRAATEEAQPRQEVES